MISVRIRFCFVDYVIGKFLLFLTFVFDYVKREKNCGLVLVGVVAAAVTGFFLGSPSVWLFVCYL